MIISSIDIGTNTILLLVADVNRDTKNIRVLRDEHRIPRIGKGVIPGRAITEDKISVLFKILYEFKQIINEYNTDLTILTATNAFRIASNSAEIVNKIKEIFEWEVNIISGEDEAKYSFLGSTIGETFYKDILVIDIGGGSTELVQGRNQEIYFRQSYPIGAVLGTEKFLRANPPSAQEIETFKDEISKIFIGIKAKTNIPEKTIAIAGTPTTLACIKQKLKSYDEYLIEGSEITYNELSVLTETLAKLRSEDIREKYQDVVKGREDVLLSGSLILQYLMEKLGLSKVTVSTKGIRYGAIVNYLLRENA